MEIRDTIHGNIRLNETEAKIVDTKEMQRLRHIKQLDVAYLIFPGANHSRFEHSLGTMQVTKELVSNIYGDNAKEFSYVGLLHDIGHGPFSHLSEPLIKKCINKNHEQLGEERIRNSEIKDIISDSGLSFDKVMSYFRDADNIDVVGGALGSDRIDYLMRDSHYTGVAYGIIDYDRIKTQLTLFNDKVAISEEGISGAESLLIARYFMYHNVYMHHAKTIAKKMLLRAIEFGLEDNTYDAKELSCMTDDGLTYKLSKSDNKIVSDIVKRVQERKLFKRAYYSKIKEDIDEAALEKLLLDAGLKKEEFVINVAALGGARDNVDVVDSDNNYIGKLAEVSPFVKTLTDVLTSTKRLLVACDKKNIEKVNPIVSRFVG